MMRGLAHPASRTRKAAALVEMAVVVPIVMIIFYGLVEISRLLLLQHTADAAAYEGARQAIVPGATADEGIAAARVLLDADQLKSAVVTIDPPEITEDTSVVTVSVSIPAAENSWLQFFALDGMNLTSEISLYCERPPVALLTGTSVIKLKATTAKLKQDTLGL